MSFKKPQKTEIQKGIKPGLTPANAKGQSQTRKEPNVKAKPWSVGR